MIQNIQPLSPNERKYTYAQSQQLIMQTGLIGYLRGDFGKSGEQFYFTWFDEVATRKTDTFRKELDEVINALRSDDAFGGLLHSRQAMDAYGHGQPDSAFQGNYCTEYGFRMDTGLYSYLLQCNPTQGDYNFYCWCYETALLNRHLSNAKEGIRFIDPQYREKFRICDGDQIRITALDGTYEDKTCRYIDGPHVEVGRSLFHICEFAEVMERSGNTILPLRSSLPEKCFALLPSNQDIITIERGKSGYERTGIIIQEQTPQECVDTFNDTIGVSKAQAAAMQAGSMFGWDTPAADPKNYDDQGKPVPPKQRDHSMER